MTDADGANQPIAPDPGMIAAFAAVLFRYSEGWVAVRAFPEKGAAGQPARTPFVAADAGLAAKLLVEAEEATKKGLALYVVGGVVSAPGKAKAGDVIAIETVLVDLDHGDITAKREHLVRHLGPPSLEVASGGTTEDGQDRLHLYWKLNEPATGADVAKVCELRGSIAARVGGDPSFRSAHQPIRVAGSVYRKGGVERLVTIRAEEEVENDLTDFAARVAAMPAMDGETGPEVQSPAGKGSVVELFARQVHEGGVDGVTRFDALSRIIGYWIRRFREGHVTREQAWEEIVAYNAARIVPPWPLDRLKQEAHRLWQRDSERHGSDQRAGGDGEDSGAEPAPTEFTEDALALEFTRRHGRDWAYVAAWGQWLTWSGGRWERETTLRAFDLARIVCREAAERCEKPALKAKIASAPTVAAIERLARADRSHAAPSDRWDRDPWLLNTPGGIVDLRTGRLGDHDRALAMTRIATATPAEHCPVWLEFLATITNNDSELQAYLQRVVGYCLTGITTEHALFFLYGTGANGKSVFVNTVSTILGDYATTAPMDMFMAATGERHPTDMAGLRGARLVAAIETEQGRRWAESKLKALTGGDKITARFMRQDFFEFIPQFKLIVAGNHKPSIRNVDEAMRRRLHLIPFTVTIPPAKRDKTLPERLLAESDGILAWAVEGCLEWQRVGLKPPTAVAAATNEYFEAEDALGRWLDECCERGAAHGETTAALYDAWKSWADASGEYAGSKKRFSENLIGRGFEPYRDRAARGFRGLRLREGSRSTDGMEF
jgi:P4 family phage/plasmid primase-like protien